MSMNSYADWLKVPHFITSSFDEPVLYTPARVENEDIACDNLKIITAFTDTERISTHLIGLSEGIGNGRFIKGLEVEIILGMTKSSLSLKKHQDICRLLHYLNETKNMPKISCRYISNGPEVHSKIYLWGQKKHKQTHWYYPELAYCGSLNYTMNAFYKRRESVSVLDSTSELRDINNYYNSLYLDTIDCFDPKAVERLKNVINKSKADIEEPDNSEKEYDEYDKKTPVNTITISLLTASGDVGYGSGVNWGIRQNRTKRNPNQAYIPYNSKDKVLGFFPDRENPDDKNCPMFRVITKDFGSFHMRMAQAGNKAIHCVESNAILGEWIRKRIGQPSGAFITRQMLEMYGNTHVTFRKYEDGTYLLDF